MADALRLSAYYETRPPSRDGIGKVYMGREISHVMGHLGARWLERPDRVREELPERVVAAMALEPSAAVADIGAGTGCFVPGRKLPAIRGSHPARTPSMAIVH